MFSEPSRRAADTQVLAPAAVIRALPRPREIGRLHRRSDEIDLDRAAEPVQPAGDTLRQPEVRDPLTGNPHNLRRAPARRFRASRVAATGADKAACEHDQVCPRIGCGGRDRPWLQPVLGGMLRGRDYERRLDGSVIEPTRRVGPRARRVAPTVTAALPGPCPDWGRPRRSRSRRRCSPTPTRSRPAIEKMRDGARSLTESICHYYDRGSGPSRLDVRALAGDLGIHSDSSAGVLDGQCAGVQSPSGSVVCPTSIR